MWLLEGICSAVLAVEHPRGTSILLMEVLAQK